MAAIAYDNNTARQLTAGIRRATKTITGQGAVATACPGSASLYTTVGDIAEAVACHDFFFRILADSCAAVEDFLDQVDSMAASFAELDAEQARASATAIGG